jgi:hypothetical protein
MPKVSKRLLMVGNFQGNTENSRAAVSVQEDSASSLSSRRVVQGSRDSKVTVWSHKYT